LRLGDLQATLLLCWRSTQALSSHVPRDIILHS
jgi:hypothetical protein